MPHFCSHCNAKIAGDSVQCPHCGQPQTASSPQDPQAESDRRFPFWTILPWTLLAAAALFFLPHLFRSSRAENPPPAAASQTLTAPAASMPSAASSTASSAPVSVPITSAEVPLTVTLSTASGRRHVPVGTPVMISAYASLPPGQSATLAISYGKDNGTKTLLALAQGTLASAAWVPTVPGHYQFTASALDSRKNSAFSHHLTLIADGAPVSAPVRQVPAKNAAARLAAAIPPAPKRTPARPNAPQPSLQAAALSKPRLKIPSRVKPYHAQPYHVAAASFQVQRIADTLAGALRQRGFHAFVRPGAEGQYQVETGDFVRRADADKQVQLLKRDGYPSYVFQSHQLRTP